MVKAIASEVRSRGYKQVLSPTINVAYDSRWGRTHETYGEDPLLVSKMGVAYIKSMEGNGVICTPKHFASNIGHNGLFGGAVHFSERFLREVEFPPFKAAIMEAGAHSIMPAYNSIDGVPCIINDWLLSDILRKEWKFKAFISSDYGALREAITLHRVAVDKVDAAIKGISVGMDVEMPHTDVYGGPLIEAVKSGRLWVALVDSCVKRVLQEKFRLGLFEEIYVDPAQAAKICDNVEHRAIAREVAQQGIVLLKNEKNTLPFSKGIKSIPVLGPLADDLLLGNYAGWGMKKVSILEGVKNKVGNTATMKFEKGFRASSVEYPRLGKEV
ncbi:MAG TPA: glycoside hydrolase family 3 N-terminal domain-containing protein [Cytophagaceae bacterium]